MEEAEEDGDHGEEVGGEVEEEEETHPSIDPRIIDSHKVRVEEFNRLVHNITVLIHCGSSIFL